MKRELVTIGQCLNAAHPTIPTLHRLTLRITGRTGSYDQAAPEPPCRIVRAQNLRITQNCLVHTGSLFVRANVASQQSCEVTKSLQISELNASWPGITRSDPSDRVADTEGQHPNNDEPMKGRAGPNHRGKETGKNA